MASWTLRSSKPWYSVQKWVNQSMFSQRTARWKSTAAPAAGKWAIPGSLSLQIKCATPTVPIPTWALKSVSRWVLIKLRAEKPGANLAMKKFTKRITMNKISRPTQTQIIREKAFKNCNSWKQIFTNFWRREYQRFYQPKADRLDMLISNIESKLNTGWLSYYQLRLFYTTIVLYLLRPLSYLIF